MDTLTLPDIASAGTVATMQVSEMIVKLAATPLLNVTPVAPVNP